MRCIALIALAALVATPALAGKGKSEVATPDANAASQQAPAATAKPPQKSCRSYQTTGTHARPERLCLTKEEWRKFDDAQ
jgi:hypothetical protein